MNKLNKFNKIAITIIIILSFLFIASQATLPLFKANTLFNGYDMQFHLNRIYEWVQDIKQSHHLFYYPIIATHTFNQVGDITPNMYPQITLYPVVLLMLIFTPITAIYTWFLLIIFFTQLIAYLCMNKYCHNKSISFIFALLYGANYTIIGRLTEYQIGMCLAYQFIPLIFIGMLLVFKHKHGWLSWLKDGYKDWWLIVYGIVGITYSHLVTFVLAVFVFAILYLCLGFSKRDVKNRFKSLVITLSGVSIGLLFSLPALLPIEKNDTQQALFTPSSQENISNSVVQPINIINEDLHSFLPNHLLSLSAILIFLLGWIGLFILPKHIKKLYYIILVFYFFLSPYFPWKYINVTNIPVLNHIQQISRFLPFFMCLTSFYGAYLIYILFCKCLSKKFVIILPMFFLIISYASNVRNINNYVKVQNQMNYPKINNQSFHKIFPSDIKPGYRDYFPEKVANSHFIKLFKHPYTINNQRRSYRVNRIKAIPNGEIMVIKHNIRRNSWINLPMLYYSTLSYRIRVNNQKARYINNKKNDTILVQVPKDVKDIKVKIIVKER